MRKQPSVLPANAHGARRPWRRRVGGARRQHGAVAVLAAIWLGVAIAALGVIDVGNVYFVRRELQRTADMAAMAAVQLVSTPGGCGTAIGAAQLNAKANGFTADNATTFLDTTCGRWDTSSKTYFSTSGNPLNAVQVQATQRLPFFFIGPARDVSAKATALASNIDAFSLGTGIASIDTQQSALLNAILGGLLHTSVSLSVGDVQSLASAHIKLDDLRVALGASSMQGLLDTSVSFQNLMIAMVSALQAGGDTVNANILQALEVAVPGGQNITIGDGKSGPGLLALGLSNPDSAATATISAFDALMVAAQIAQSGQLNPDGTVAKPGPVINIAAGLKGVAGLSLQITNPPVLAVGEGGTLSDGTTYRTIARTADVNLNVTLLPEAVPPIPVGLPSVLAVSLSVLSTPIDLQLTVGHGTAKLSSVDCESSKKATQATILVQPSIASVCVSGDSSCNKPVGLLAISAQVLGINMGTVANIVLQGTGRLNLQPPSPQTLVFNGASGSFDSTQTVNSNAIGSDLSTLTGPLLKWLPGALRIQLFNNSVDLSGLLGQILGAATDALTPLLKPVFGLLDTILLPTLSLLGIQVGTATVHNMSLTCGVPQLVN
jgi:uncharacterized membrane protein